MAADFFRIYRGLELDEAIQFLTGVGAPGASGDSASAPRGSYFTDSTTGDLYLKTAVGTGTDKWSKMATQTYVQSLGLGVSWREPVSVVDTTSTTIPVIVNDLNTDDSIQGVSVFAGMRILAANNTGNKNVFIVGGTSGNWTLTEDSNDETAGDTVYITGGTESGKTYNYTAAGNWVWIDADDQTELAFLRAYTGKDAAGNEMPTYSSTNYVTTGTSLETAIGALDAQLQLTSTDVTDAATENGYQNLFMGKNAGAEMPDWSTANYITASNDLVAAILELDSQLFTTTSDLADTNTEIGFIQSFIGKSVGNDTPAYSSTEYVSNGDSLEAAIGSLDAAISLTTKTTTALATTSVALDTVAAISAEWIVYIRDTATPATARAVKVFAMHNGTTADYTTFGMLASAPIAGLNISVTFSSGSLVLNVAATSNIDVKAQRIGAIEAF